MAEPAVVSPPVGAAGAVAPKRVTERVAVAQRVQRRLIGAHTIAHGVGMIDVALLIIFVLPEPSRPAGAQLWPLIVATAVYVPLSFAVAIRLASRFSPTAYAWLAEGRRPTERERYDVLAHPMRCVRTDGGFWLGGAVLLGLVSLPASTDVAFHVGTTVALGGLTVCALAYLIDERIMRPVTALALLDAPPMKPYGPGVKGRLVLVYLCATGVPILGLLMMGLHALNEGGVTAERLAIGIIALGGGGFVVGLIGTVAAAKSLAEPLGSVRRALAHVEAGDLATAVEVNDGSEVGLLQSGFNRMAMGLRERERLRDLLSRQVGEDVAEAAVAEHPELGGRVQEVSVLFVDMVGSTALAASRPPEEVVAHLNRFFAVVVETVEARGGWINKFEGDAALCVFGAPVELEDHAGCALAAARTLHAGLARARIAAGIGVSSGAAVAGWVGTERRFEYTVVGDPVNEAARLCDAAKRDPRGLLASGDILRRSGAGEAGRWALAEELELRGRGRPTRVAAPVAGVS